MKVLIKNTLVSSVIFLIASWLLQWLLGNSVSVEFFIGALGMLATNTIQIMLRVFWGGE